MVVYCILQFSNNIAENKCAEVEINYLAAKNVLQ